MPLYRPSELTAFLEEHGFAARKRLSQNFLIDKNNLEKILSIAAIEAGDCVLEIGPGPGVITEALLEKKARVFAVEIDKGFAQTLPRLGNLELICGDALEVPLPHGPAWKVISNVPYQISSPLLDRLLPLRYKSLTMTFQKEFADRLKTTNRLSLLCQYYSTFSQSFVIGKNSFYPKPKVDSACVHFVPHTTLALADPSQFFIFVRMAFSQPRKTFLNNFPKETQAVLHAALVARGLPSDMRPERLLLADFLALFSSLC